MLLSPPAVATSSLPEPLLCALGSLKKGGGKVGRNPSIQEGYEIYKACGWFWILRYVNIESFANMLVFPWVRATQDHHCDDRCFCVLPNPWQAYNFADAWNNTNNSPLCSQFREAKQKNPLTKRLSRLGSTRPVPPIIPQIKQRLSRGFRGPTGTGLLRWQLPTPKTNSQTSSGWRSRFLIRYLIANSIALLVTAKASKADTCTIVGKEGLSGESATAKPLRDSTWTFQEPSS